MEIGQLMHALDVSVEWHNYSLDRGAGNLFKKYLY